jgi:hypothetical protein
MFLSQLGRWNDDDEKFKVFASPAALKYTGCTRVRTLPLRFNVTLVSSLTGLQELALIYLFRGRGKRKKKDIYMYIYIFDERSF